MEPIVKKATIDDLGIIQELNSILFRKEYSEFDKTLNCEWTNGTSGTDYFRSRITKDDSCALISLVGERVVGYIVGALAQTKDYRNVKRMAELENMFILEDFQRYGIGTKLFDGFLEWCKSKEATRLKVVASEKNTQAINFYRKNGFKDHDLTLEREL